MPDEKITICPNDHERAVPLIFTFAFPGCEYWCPVCGHASGMLGAGPRVAATPALIERRDKYEQQAAEYLHARSTLVCDSLLWEGKRIKPTELPREVMDRNQRIVREWRGLAES